MAGRPAGTKDSELVPLIQKNFWKSERNQNSDFKPPRLEKAFAYHGEKLWSGYLIPFLDTDITTTIRTKFASCYAAIDAMNAKSKDADVRQLTESLLNFHKFVLPLCTDGISGLPLYFSPRPLRSGALTNATQRHPLSSILMHPQPRPSAETVSSAQDAVQIVKNANKTTKTEKVDYYASIKFDGHAAVWTGKGLISKEGNSAVVWTPITLSNELKDKFSGDILLGELVMVHTKEEVNDISFDTATTDQERKMQRMFKKSGLTNFYRFNPGTDTASINKKLERMMFFVYDIISYDLRELSFSERQVKLRQKTNKLTRVKLIEQIKLPLLDSAEKTSTRWNIPGKPKGQNDLFKTFGPLAKSNQGEYTLNMMILGCITENQEGLILTPDVPYYNMHANAPVLTRRQRIKVKPRIRFMARLSEPDEKAKAVWYQNPQLGKYYGDISFKAHLLRKKQHTQWSNTDITISRKYRVQGREIFVLQKEDEGPEVDPRYRGCVSIVNTFSFTGMRVEAQLANSRNLLKMLPAGVNIMAHLYHRKLLDLKLFDDPQNLLSRNQINEDSVEALLLAQIGCNLNFSEFPVVHRNVLRFETEKPKLRFGRNGASHPAPFPNEPTDETLFRMLANLVIDELRTQFESYNRWLPVLRRSVENTETEWRQLKNFSLPGQMLICVKRLPNIDLVDFVPDGAIFYRQTEPTSDVFTYADKEMANSDKEVDYYIDGKNLQRGQGGSIRVTIEKTVPSDLQVREITTKVSETLFTALTNGSESYKTERELTKLEDAQYANIFASVENAGLAQYNSDGDVLNIRELYVFLCLRALAEKNNDFITNYNVQKERRPKPPAKKQKFTVGQRVQVTYPPGPDWDAGDYKGSITKITKKRVVFILFDDDKDSVPFTPKHYHQIVVL